MKIFETREQAVEHLNSLPADIEAVERHTKKGRKHHDDREESFQRCDTDGFVSQWASGLTGSLEERRAELASHDHNNVFRVLVDAETGKLASTKCLKVFNKFAGYGTVDRWVVTKPKGERDVWLTDYKRPENFIKKGYRLAWATAKAYARLDGEGTGLSGHAWVATHIDREAEGINV